MSTVFATLLKITPVIALSLTTVSVDAKSLITPKSSRDSAPIQADCSSKTLNANTGIKSTRLVQRPGRTGRTMGQLTQND